METAGLYLEAMNSQLRDERREMDFNWDKKYSVYYTDTALHLARPQALLPA